MHRFIIYKIYSNDTFLSDVSDDDYDRVSFSYKVETTVKLRFIPPIGLTVKLTQTDFTVDSLTFDVLDDCFYVFDIVDLVDHEVARKLVSNHLNDGWHLV
ncbi:hypothetical protein DFO79_1261 [Pseudidiomarina tainanensis]|uniref:Uncharacterized protein n=2 Tax=Pseudidiomarina TaxID=2800384 RepID=A0A368UJN0_9GAMM|nr:hypothetical protein DET45_1291 [Pseudidiomarina maritima]RBP86591.1 hypothetical protein DFO81_1281 [Pseudidiomarina tainanensis]RCW28868.1 hypothetical protein DFO79_1261 [Pseudidiomarina tainanensis]